MEDILIAEKEITKIIVQKEKNTMKDSTKQNKRNEQDKLKLKGNLKIMTKSKDEKYFFLLLLIVIQKFK